MMVFPNGRTAGMPCEKDESIKMAREVSGAPL